MSSFHMQGDYNHLVNIHRKKIRKENKEENNINCLMSNNSDKGGNDRELPQWHQHRHQYFEYTVVS